MKKMRREKTLGSTRPSRAAFGALAEGPKVQMEIRRPQVRATTFAAGPWARHARRVRSPETFRLAALMFVRLEVSP